MRIFGTLGAGSREREPVNRISGTALILLSLAALVCVASGYLQQPQADEGTAAHIFQLSIAGLVPTLLLFLATADWSRPARSLRPLVFATATLIVAFGGLYYLEHYWWPARTHAPTSLSRPSSAVVLCATRGFSDYRG